MPTSVGVVRVPTSPRNLVKLVQPRATALRTGPFKDPPKTVHWRASCPFVPHFFSQPPTKRLLVRELNLRRWLEVDEISARVPEMGPDIVGTVAARGF